MDIAAARIVREVEVGAEPEGMAVSPDGRWIVCTSESASLAHFIDSRTGRLLASEMVGTRPREARFSPDGRTLWVSSEVRGNVTVFDMPSRHRRGVVDLDVEGAPDTVQAVGISFSGDGARAYVALGRGNGVAEIDARSLRVVRWLQAGSRVWSVGLAEGEQRLYAANGLSGDASVVDLKSGRALATVKTGGKPWGVVVRP